MKSKLFLSARFLSLVLLMLLTALSYHPSFAKFVTDGEGQNPLNKYIYLALGITVILHLQFKRIIKNKFARTFVAYIALIAVTGKLLQAFNISDNYISEAQNCFMAFTFLFIGYNAKLNRDQLLILLILYGAMVLYTTLMQIMVNLGGFTLSPTYIQYGKNALGVMTSSSCVALAYYGLIDHRKRVKITTIAMAVLLLIFTITIRARASFLSTFILLGFIVFRKVIADKKTADIFMRVFFIFLICAFVLAFSPDTISSVSNYIYESFTLNQGDDLTSGRMDRNEIALGIIENNPFFGNLAIGQHYEWVHNYFLRQFSSYGFIAGFPLLALYLYITFFVLMNTFKSNLSFRTIGFIAVVIPIIISLEEPTFPYAPGTASILSFTMLGFSLSEKDALYE